MKMLIDDNFEHLSSKDQDEIFQELNLKNTHPETEECRTYGCCIHNVTNHHMKSWMQNWRNDRKMMERICPHGIGHPDPDHMSWFERTHGKEAASYEGIHGCDGCCSVT
jgi:hypothetical protein